MTKDEAQKLINAGVVRAQNALSDFIHPDSEISPRTCVHNVMEILDNVQFIQAQNIIETAPSKASPNT